MRKPLFLVFVLVIFTSLVFSQEKTGGKISARFSLALKK